MVRLFSDVFDGYSQSLLANPERIRSVGARIRRSRCFEVGAWCCIGDAIVVWVPGVRHSLGTMLLLKRFRLFFVSLLSGALNVRSFCFRSRRGPSMVFVEWPVREKQKASCEEVKH